VSDTLAQSHVNETSQTPAAAAEAAAESKTNKYSSSCQSCLFVSGAAETMGAINKDGMDFLSDIGRCVTQNIDGHRKIAFLFRASRNENCANQEFSCDYKSTLTETGYRSCVDNIEDTILVSPFYSCAFYGQIRGCAALAVFSALLCFGVG